MLDLEEIWEYREESIYPSIFGDLGEGIFPLSADIFTQQFKATCDPRWLHYGIFQSPPNEKRSSWLYVSSGMSNPWEQENKEKISGYGVEFILETHTKSMWAIQVLQNMVAYNTLLVHGHFGEKSPLDYGDRIPLNQSISPDYESDLRNLLIAEPANIKTQFELASGKVDFLLFIGTSDDEIIYAKENGSAELLELLKEREVYPYTDPRRESVV